MGLTGEGTSPDELWDLGGREPIAEHLRELADAKLAAKEEEVGAEDWSTVERLVLVRTIDSLWVEHLTEIDDMRRGIGLRGYAQQDPLNEFRREAFRMYEELRGLIRHGVASTIFRVTVTREPAPGDGPRPMPGPGQPPRPNAPKAGPDGGGPGDGGPTNGKTPGAGPDAAPGKPAAVLAGGIPTGPVARNIRESLGDEALVSAAGAAGAATPAGGARPGYTPDGARIGRNDPCWCGSGAKYKKCHGR